VGTASLIARRLGSSQQGRANSAAGHAFVLAAAGGAAFLLLALGFRRELFGLLGASPTVMPLVMDYGTWIFAGSPFMFFGAAAASILRGQGDMKTPMFVMVVAVLLNVALDPVLIFGIGPFPRLEVAGAGLATFASRSLGAVLMGAYVLGGRSLVRAHFRRVRFRPAIVAGILRVGVPSAANHIIMSVGFAWLIRIIARFGKEAVAAYGLAIRLNRIAILPCLGIATAVVTLVGHNVGAGRLDRAEATAWKAAAFAMVAMESIGVLLFLLPGPFMRVFTTDREVIAHGVRCLRVISLTYMFIGLSIIMAASFQGAGRGLPALAISALRLIALAVPAAYVLSALVGLQGVWFAIAGSSVLAGLLSAAWFAAGTWRRRGG
jgi:putative MATE family efflux protein